MADLDIPDNIVSKTSSNSLSDFYDAESASNSQPQHEIESTIIVNPPQVTSIREDSLETATPTKEKYSEGEGDGLTTTSVVSTESLSGFFYKCGINLILPFINGMMLGFGEILAHEIGFKYNWSGARVSPARRMLAISNSRDSKEKKSVLFN